jgi:clan AA aspartic protease
MIVGEVTPDNEVMVPLTLIGVDGRHQETRAAIDTGFTDYVTLPSSLISKLQLEYHSTTWFTLADGNSVPLKAFEAAALWDGAERDVVILEAEGTPLIGMALLHGHRLTVEVVDGGRVRIEALS